MSTKTIASGTVADAYLALLADRGIDYLFANAGTDFAPIIESLAKGQETSMTMPTPVTVPHENVAIAMAMGHYLVSGRPQAVMVHVNVGTANAMCGLMNAWRGQIPVILTAGRTPFSESGVPASRTGEIHWPQEMRDQRAMVREIVKWDYELPNAEVLEASVDRALNIAMSQPSGPVYMTLPREVLASPIQNFGYTSPSPRAAPTAPFPDPGAIEHAAEMIAGAEDPLIITSCSGRNEEEVEALSTLAERAAIPVTQRKPRYMCLPSDHPMHAGYRPEDFFEAADVVVVIECDVPWLPLRASPRADAKVIHIGADPIFSDYPLRGFRCDLAITGTVGATLPRLTDAITARNATPRVEARRGRIADLRKKRSKVRQATLEKARAASPIHPAWITHCIDQVTDDDAIVVKESPLVFDQMNFTKPGSMFSTGSAGALGWGLGTALGIKSAARDKLVICTVGDGAYMFGNPVPAHYVAKAEDLPILTIIFNNEMWGAVKRTTKEVYPDGYAARSNRPPLTYFDPGTHFEKVVEIVGGYGERVENAEDLPAALERAVREVKNGRQALLNVICSGP